MGYFKDLNQEIQKLLAMPNNWDDNGARCIDPIAAEYVKHFIANQCAGLHPKLKPIISPCADGTIDIYWNVRVEEIHVFNLTVNIGHKHVEFFGESADKFVTVKGKFNPFEHPKPRQFKILACLVSYCSDTLENL